MIKRKYSPAPWKQEETDDGDVIVIMDEAHQVLIGNLEGSCSICHANATLIEFAPEMFEALENLLDATKYMREEYSDADEEAEKARIILSKIKGEL